MHFGPVSKTVSHASRGEGVTEKTFFSPSQLTTQLKPPSQLLDEENINIDTKIKMIYTNSTPNLMQHLCILIP